MLRYLFVVLAGAAGVGLLLVTIGIAFVDFGGWLIGVAVFAVAWILAGKWQKVEEEVQRERARDAALREAAWWAIWRHDTRERLFGTKEERKPYNGPRYHDPNYPDDPF